MVNIKNEIKKTEYENVNEGEMFLYADTLYYKVHYNGSVEPAVVNMEKGLVDLDYFAPDEMVKIVNVDIIIK